MNSEKSKTSNPERILLNLSNKINLKRSDNYVALSNLSIYYTWENIKKLYKSNEILMPETMNLLGSTNNKITKDENGENVPHLEITKVVLVHCNIVNNDYQQDSKVLYTFIPNKSFGQLQEISPKYFVFLNTFNSEFSYIEVLLTDQNSKPLEIEDKINITLVINQSVKYKK